MPARPGRRESCGPRFLTTTSWLPSDFVDVDRDALLGAAHDHDGAHPARPLARARAELQQRAEPEERQRRVAELVARRSRTRSSISAGVARRTISTSVDGTATVLSPQRSITTCVTAVVSGRTSLNDVPWPAAVAVSMRPPMAITSERTTSMPTPRPASSVTVSTVEKPA